MGRPISAKARTPSGPWAEKNSSPSFRPPTYGFNRSARTRAYSRSVVSIATKTGLFTMLPGRRLFRRSAIQSFAQFLAGAEKRSALLAHRNRLAGARIAPHSCRPHLYRESAKAAQLHAMTFGQRLG